MSGPIYEGICRVCTNVCGACVLKAQSKGHKGITQSGIECVKSAFTTNKYYGILLNKRVTWFACENNSGDMNSLKVQKYICYLVNYFSGGSDVKLGGSIQGRKGALCSDISRKNKFDSLTNPDKLDC